MVSSSNRHRACRRGLQDLEQAQVDQWESHVVHDLPLLCRLIGEVHYSDIVSLYCAGGSCRGKFLSVDAATQTLTMKKGPVISNSEKWRLVNPVAETHDDYPANKQDSFASVDAASKLWEQQKVITTSDKVMLKMNMADLFLSNRPDRYGRDDDTPTLSSTAILSKENDGINDTMQIWKVTKSNLPYDPEWNRERPYLTCDALVQPQAKRHHAADNGDLNLPPLSTYPPSMQESIVVDDLLYVFLGVEGRYIKLAVTESRVDASKPQRSLKFGLNQPAGDTNARKVFSFLMERASVPYLKMVERWIYHGDLVDPYDEFMIRRDDQVSKEDVQDNPYSTYWQSRYTIRAPQVPLFLSRVAQKILTAGKYLNVFRTCNRQVDCPFAGAIIFSPSESVYEELIDKAHGFASRMLLDLFVRDNDLQNRLISLKHYFLMDQGDFFVDFMDVAEEELKLRADKLSLSRLESLLHLSLQTSTCSSDPYKDDLQCFLSPHNLISHMEAIHQRAQKGPGDSLTTFESSSIGHPGYKVIDAFTLDYNVKWPLSLVISCGALTKYQMIFRHIFFCKHVERQLCDAWLNHQATKELSLRSALGPSFCLRQRMLHFQQNFVYYMMFEVISPRWHDFQQQLACAGTVDDILEFQGEFLDICLKECLLTDPDLLRVLTKLMTVCMTFANSIECFTRPYFLDEETIKAEREAERDRRAEKKAREEAETALASYQRQTGTFRGGGKKKGSVLRRRQSSQVDMRRARIKELSDDVKRALTEREGDQENPFVRMTNDLENQFDSLLGEFMQQLLRRSLLQQNSHLSNLCTRLDYNGFYTNGIARFRGVFIDVAGSPYKLRYTTDLVLDGGNTVVTNPFTVAQGVCNKVVIMNAPTAAKGGKAFSIQPVLKLIDSGGNTLEADSSSLVRVSIAANPSRGALKPTDALIAYVRKGFAVFRGLKIDKAGSGYSLRFTVYNKVEGKNQWKKLDIQNVTGTFDVLMGTPVSLYLQRNLSDGVLDGQPNEVQPVVALLDSGGNVVSSLETGSVTAAMVSSASVSSSIVVDTSAAPFLTVSSVRAVTSASYPMPYGVGARVSIQVTFSDEVAVKGAPTLELASSTGGYPRLFLETGPIKRPAGYFSGSGSKVLTFVYRVSTGDTSGGGFLNYRDAQALSFNGGTITRYLVGSSGMVGPPAVISLADSTIAGKALMNNAHLTIDGLPPTVTGITMSSAPSTTVTRDNEVVISISFSALVTVDTTKGTPSLQMAVGDYNREAVYTSGNNTQALLFSYIVRLGDEAPNGLGDVASGLTYVSQSALTLNSGTALRFEYTIKTGDTARSLDYADTTALDVNGARILTCTASTNVAPTQNVDLHLNPPGGRLLGTTVKPVTFGKATFTDLVVDRLGFDYRVMFYTLYEQSMLETTVDFDMLSSAVYGLRSSPYASGDNLGSSVDIDGNTLVLGGPGASEPIAAVQVVTALGDSKTFVNEIQVLETTAKQQPAVQVLTSTAAPGETIGGWFYLKLGFVGPTRRLPFNADPVQVSVAMELDLGFDPQTISVSRELNTYCACSNGYVWYITFLYAEGPLEALVAISTQLTGRCNVDEADLSTILTQDLHLNVWSISRAVSSAMNTYTWSITFTASDTLYDVPQLTPQGVLLTGYGAGLTVRTERNGQGRLSGSFRLRFRTDLFPNDETDDISVSATDHDVEVALEKLVSVNDVIVQRTASMNAFGGFSWTVTFVQVNTKNDYGPVVDTSGNLPALAPVTTKLQGTNARVVIQAGGYERSALTADGLGTNWGVPGGSAVWSLFQTLSAAPQVITSGDRFGEAVAVSGSATTTVAVGAPGYATDSGAVFVFDLVGGYFQSRQMLLQESPVMAPGDRFGNALDLDMFSTYTLVVGAHRHTFRRVGAIDAVDNGLALVFTRRSSNDILFALQQVLYGSDTRANDRFGTSVAVAKDTIVVGAHELYEGARTIRKPVQAITTSVLDSETTGIIQGGSFVLSFLQSNAGEDPTSMTTLKRMQTQSIVYDISPSGLEAILERDFEMTNIIVRRDGPSTSKEYTWYVTFADSSGEVPLLEADTTELLGAEVTVTQTIRMAPVLRGTAYAFTRDANGKWTEQASLFPRKKQYFAWFGSAVAVDKRTAIVGAPNLDTYVTGTNSGGGFVFDLGILSLRFSFKTYNVLEGDKWDVVVQRCSSYGAFCAIDVSAAPQLYINYDTGDAFSDRQSGPTYVAVDPQDVAGQEPFPQMSKGRWLTAESVGTANGRNQFYGSRELRSLWVDALFDYAGTDSVQYQILERTVEQEYAFGQALDMDRRTIIVGAPFSDGGAFTAQQYHSDDFDRRFFGRGTTREIGYGSTTAEIKAALEGTDGRDGDGSTIEALGFRLLEVIRTGMIDQGFSWSVTFIGEILVIPVLTATWSGYGCTSCKAFSSSYATDPSRQVAVSETVAIGSKWRQQTRIMAPDGNPGDQFGFSVAISGEQTIVGAASSSALTSTTWDFETGDLTGWLTTGTAFDQQPTYGDNSYARINTYRPYQYPGAAPPGQSAHHEGRYWVGTFEARTGAGKATTAAQRAAQMCAFANDELCRAPNYKLPSASAPAGTTQGDGPQGTLISLPFTIEGPWMSFRVGGGCDVRVVYVELLIDGQSAAVPETVAAEQIAVEVTSRGSTTKPTNTARPVSATSKLRATGRCDETMQEVTWDLSAFQNRSAQIRVVDASSSVVWGHINFDDVRFSWGATRVAQVSTSKAGEAYTFRRRAPGTQFPTAKCEGMNRWYCEWEFQARLIASDKRGEDRFGFNVAVDDTTGLAVISAPGQRAVDANNTIEHILTDGLDASKEGLTVMEEVGSVYVYRRADEVRDGAGVLLRTPSLDSSDLVVGAPGISISPVLPQAGRAFAYDLAVAGVRFTNPWFACIEGNADGLVGLTLSRSAATSNLTRALTIGYATEDRSAVGVDAMKFAACLKISSTQRKDCGDYQQIAGEVTFAAGETSKLVTIPIMEDTCFEQWEEHFVVRLHVPGGEPLLGEHFIARKFRKCFSGVEAVDWILQHKQARDTYEAVRKGQTLLDQHFITMVDGAAKFQCHPKRFYSFTSMATTA
ncbi:hypothetical protein BBP00_00003556 [Phytophthora kernoviae]|uniref:DEP domain-containing protein n=1 Tax=Phytophthora kernoviae TaxID=325452 RepID=A0A3F2RW03_9STRA|nr:hypothetical protein BBP00_00003556 [Phytophthora kernoviae]